MDIYFVKQPVEAVDRDAGLRSSTSDQVNQASGHLIM